MSDLIRKPCDGLSCDEKGTVVSRIARLNVVDQDREVIPTGAIPAVWDGWLSGYGHDAMFGNAPVGKGTGTVEGNDAMFRGRYFMSTMRGREFAALTKELGPAAQWSFSFQILASEPATGEWAKKGALRVLTKIQPFEVSPVILGACGPACHTISAKCAACTTPKAKPDPELERIVRENVRRMERHRAFSEALREGDRGILALDVAEKATRWLTGGRRQESMVVRFFDGDDKRAGYFDPHKPGEIFISRDLPLSDIPVTVGHEISHALRPEDDGEEIARLEGEFVARRYRESFDAEAA